MWSKGAETGEFMSDFMTNDAMRARRARQNQSESETLAEDKTAGVNALTSIAQRTEGDNEAGPAPRAALADTDSLALQIKRLSAGKVAEATRHGPVLSAGPHRRKLNRGTFMLALRPKDRVIIAVLSVLWGVCLVGFWQWWLQPVHQTSALGAVLNAIALGYLTCFPICFVVPINRLRVVNRTLPVPPLRVAFIVTRAPSEPWPVAEATLRAMLQQDFPLPYDVWLADESPSEEILHWCGSKGVIVCTRNGVDEYHRLTWPRRTKCKEGNLAFFYDHWGYYRYDVVVQLDCDHVPGRTYLTEMVRPFSDPAIGYVAAPSICDTNAGESWSARGRLHAESAFHGAFQLGHSAGWSPLCIGSHYAVRTAALREIGGIGPELAEDFSTTFLLNSAGWHGAFAIDAEAHGDGPGTFAAMLVQEFQWSKSLTMLLLNLVPRNLARLDWPHRFRFIYPLCYYILLTVSMMIGVLLPPFAAVTGRPWINVNYFAFVLHWWPLSIWLILLAAMLRRRNLLRPADAPLVSWENYLYILVRWPYILRGVCSALAQTVRPRAVTFKVTPKGVGGFEVLPTRLMLPYWIISLVCSASAVVGEDCNSAAGYVFLCVVAALTYGVVGNLVPVLHARQMARRVTMTTCTAIRLTSMLPLILGILCVLPALYAAADYPAYAIRVFELNSYSIQVKFFL
jgi:cellulose synthase/poly-beta-1,6-N-acetylglucosamine synthase-like glycosyltransferase